MAALQLATLCMIIFLGQLHAGEAVVRRMAANSNSKCCTLHPKPESIGLAIGDPNRTSEVIVDVGQCVLNFDGCHGDLNSLPKGCTDACYAKKMAVQTYVVQRHGAKTIHSIKSCACTRRKRCVRLRKIVVYFNDTEYETRVDVGDCSHSQECSGNTACKPVAYNTTVILGPNGHEVVRSVTECGCVSSCYRLPYYEQHLETYAVNGILHSRWKTIDVGRCTGSCSVPVEPTDPPSDVSGDPNFCELWLNCTSAQIPPNLSRREAGSPLGLASLAGSSEIVCEAVATETIRFPGFPEREVAVPTITQCGCVGYS